MRSSNSVAAFKGTGSSGWAGAAEISGHRSKGGKKERAKQSRWALGRRRGLQRGPWGIGDSPPVSRIPLTRIMRAQLHYLVSADGAGGSEHLLGPGTHPEVFGKILPSHYAGRINQELRGPRDVVAFRSPAGVQQVVAANNLGFGV